MRMTKTRALALAILAVLFLALPAVAMERPTDSEPTADRAEQARSFQEIVTSLWEQLRAIVTGGGPQSGDDDQTPGSSMDPDGNRPDYH